MSVAEKILKYEDCVGTAFWFKVPGFSEPVSVTLVDFKSSFPGGGFGSASLVFEGPAQPFMPQDYYEITTAESEPVTWFVTPVGESATGYHYQTIFTWLLPTAGDEEAIANQGGGL